MHFKCVAMWYGVMDGYSINGYLVSVGLSQKSHFLYDILLQFIHRFYHLL